MNVAPRAAPQWRTSSRLLKLGESIQFDFYLPAGLETHEASELAIFPRYLERAEPAGAFVAGGDLEWVNAREPERVELSFHAGQATASYQPRQPGSYLARWRAGGEVFHRYFSAIEDDWIVLRFSAFIALEPEPTLHATGIPLDYRLPIDQYEPDNPVFQRLLGYHRHFGDTLAPQLPDTPRLSQPERLALYGSAIERVRGLLPDPNDARCVRVEMRHDLDPGYVAALAQLGVNDLYGLQEANAKPWLGMPEFPYFASPLDARKVSQEPDAAVVAHQWDFCGGWHFIGPVSWHYGMAGGDWGTALRCIREGMEEARNLVELSGHPAFLLPLYDGVTWPGIYRSAAYPVKAFRDDFGDESLYHRFVERYQRQIAFDFTKEYKLAFARSLDVADYYRRHVKTTPRTVFVSKTDHVLYDVQWLCTFNAQSVLVTRERIPWETRTSSIMAARRAGPFWKDPLSYEYVVVEDQKRHVRFERESPNPVWWYDYTRQESELTPGGSAITHVETPDVDVIPAGWARTATGWTTTLRLRTKAEFPDYAIALWGLPAPFSRDRSRVETSAVVKEFVTVKNVDGEFHLVLVFDLKPDLELRVTLRDP